jgi:hypothetical protein
MPLLTTTASASAKGYGFGLVSTVNDSVSVSGESANASLGSVSVFTPKPVPANQYWTAFRFTVSGAIYIYTSDLFDFVQSPSPAITSIPNTSASLGSVSGANFQAQAASSGFAYLWMGNHVEGSTVFNGARVRRINVSTGAVPSVSTIVSFSYDTSGGTRFINNTSNSLSVRSRIVSGAVVDRLGIGYRYQNSSAQDRYDTAIYNVNAAGTATNTPATIPISANTYEKRVTAVHPVLDDVIAIGGGTLTSNGTLSSSATGYIWTYKNYGISLQEVLRERAVTSSVTTDTSGNTITNLVWSNSGTYLFAATSQFRMLVYKYDYSTNELTFLQRLLPIDGVSSSGGNWTVDDESWIFGNSKAYTRSGDTFGVDPAAQVNAPGASQGRFNYNGSYLLVATNNMTNTENLKVYEYGSLNVITPAVISVNNANRTYQTSVMFPVFDGTR